MIVQHHKKQMMVGKERENWKFKISPYLRFDMEKLGQLEKASYLLFFIKAGEKL